MDILLFLGALSILLWLGILLHPARPWDFQPVGEDTAVALEAGQRDDWPSVCILVPARNEAESLPLTLPTLLKQEYPGQIDIIVIDDRSEDGTGGIAQRIGHKPGQTIPPGKRLRVLTGMTLPLGWVGKVWALEQGAAVCGMGSPDADLPRPHGAQEQLSVPHYVLLSDADIRHAPHSVWQLVVESEQQSLALNSRMARLRCVSKAEQLLIPAFVFFFNLLYPMRSVNTPTSRVAASAGGCVLLSASGLKKIGGFASIKNEIIDDVNLAREIKERQLPIRLTLSRHDVSSVRTYDVLASIWTMVRRTAFTELDYSGIRLIGAVSGLGLLFCLPPMYVVIGIGFTVFGRSEVPVQYETLLASDGVLLAAAGFGSLTVMAGVYRPAVRFFGLSAGWSWTLPLVGILYGAMTLDSALQYWTGKRIGWRDS